jgi:uncharacterized cofD-like protein
LLVPDIAAALRATRALRVFVCNVATQPGETDGFSCQDHLAVIEAHVGKDLFDLVLVNHAFEGQLPPKVAWVRVEENRPLPYPMHSAALCSPDAPARHDPEALATTLMRLLESRTGPLKT